MSTNVVLDGIAEVLGSVAGVPAAEVTPEAAIADDLGIDSLTLVEVVVAIEDRFGGVIPDDDWARFTTVGDIVAHLQRMAGLPR